MSDTEITPGAMVEGTVSHLNPFGAFIDLTEHDSEALLHIGEMVDADGMDVDWPEQVIVLGETRMFRVGDIDTTTNRVYLSMRKLVEVSEVES